MEEWKSIVGYENLYEVSTYGKIKSLKTNKILRSSCNHKGYHRLVLYKNKRTKSISIHRLVALTFIENPENKEQVNHKDGKKDNNYLENLEWCTNTENMKHAVEFNLRRGPSKFVLQYNIEGNFIKKWNSCIEAGEILKISSTAIYNVAIRRKNYITAGDFMWRYPSSDGSYELKINPVSFYDKRQVSVEQFSKSGEFIQNYICITDAFKATNIDMASIVRCCKGKVKSAGGFKWKYKENN